VTVIVSCCNQKGGVGKTTTAVHIAHGLAVKHYQVLLVDLDPQAQCSSYLGMAQEDGVFTFLVNRPPLREVVRNTGRDGLLLLPGSKRTKTAETIMAIEQQKVDTLAVILASTTESPRLHFIVIDTAPSAGGLQENALWAADLLVIPSAVDHLSLEGVAEIIKTLRATQRPTPPIVKVLPTFYDDVTRESTTNLDRLREAFGDAVMDPIHRAAVLRECPAMGKTIFEYQPESRAAKEYAAVVWGVLNAIR
jgi:chromosome partitioning protein